MATINFRIRNNSNKPTSIKVIFVNGKETQLELKTGFSILPSEWSEEKKLPKQTKAENKLISANLLKLRSYIFEKHNQDAGSGIVIDSHWMKLKIDECFNRLEVTDNSYLVNHVQYIIDNAANRKIKVKGGFKIGLSESRKKGYEAFLNISKEYEAKLKKQITFMSINESFVSKFETWLMNEKKYSVNYSGKQIDNLKTVCLDAIKCEIPTNNFVKQIQGFSEADEDRFIVTLSFDDLDKIRTSDKIVNDSHINARKWLLIGCEIGQRGGDLLSITKDDIRYKSGNMYIDVIQQKTKKSVTIGVINPHIIDIIENGFPHKISTQKMNDYIKKVCELAEINEIIEGKKYDEITKRKKLNFYPKYELVTTHSFRRSFATNYYKIIPTPILIAITGHSKESEFLKYINKHEDKDANADLFMKFYEQINQNKEPQLKKVL